MVQMNLQNRNRVTDVENKSMVTRGRVGGRINNKNLLCSTGNSFQYSVMT